MLITEMCGDAIDRSAAGASEVLGRAGLPRFHFQALVTGSARSQRRVTMVSSASLVVRGEIPFRGRDADYRAIPVDTKPEDLLISHISINFDNDRLRGGDPLFVYGRHRPGADASCPRIGRPAEGGRRRRRHSPLGSTALHARRERARALAGVGRDRDGCHRFDPAAGREHQAAARVVGAIRIGGGRLVRQPIPLFRGG